jgi:toxin CcdB
MQQFDVCRTRGALRKHAPYLVVLQSDLIDLIRTAVVAPMRPLQGFGPIIKGLHVVESLDGESHVLSPEEMAAVPRSVLGECIGSLAAHRSRIIAALDLLFTGH